MSKGHPVTSMKNKIRYLRLKKKNISGGLTSKYVKHNLKTFRREYTKIYLWAQNKECVIILSHLRFILFFALCLEMLTPRDQAPLPTSFQLDSSTERDQWVRGERGWAISSLLLPTLGSSYSRTHPPIATVSAGAPFSRALTLIDSSNTISSPFPCRPEDSKI